MVNATPLAEQACSFMERRHASQPVPTPLAVGDTPFGDDRTPQPVGDQIPPTGAAGASLVDMSIDSMPQLVEVVNQAMGGLHIHGTQSQSEEAVEEVMRSPDNQADEVGAYMRLMVQKMLLQPSVAHDNINVMPSTYEERVEQGQGLYKGLLEGAIRQGSEDQVAAVLSLAKGNARNPLTPAYLTRALREDWVPSWCDAAARMRIRSLLLGHGAVAEM